MSFPGGSFAPTRVAVAVRGEVRVKTPLEKGRGEGPGAPVAIRARAAAEISPDLGVSLGQPAYGSGGGYDGPLAYRMGKPMRPDVAVAFDRMAAAARREAGLFLSISSAFRSDAEQAVLFAANPNPKWVAPPGTSLHRYATELDLGPPAAYPWLQDNHRRFGFIWRYRWEPWHYELSIATNQAGALVGHRQALGCPIKGKPPNGRSALSGLVQGERVVSVSRDAPSSRQSEAQFVRRSGRLADR